MKTKLPGPVDEVQAVVDGFCFDETAGYDFEQINRLAATGKIYLTQFRGFDRNRRECTFGGSVYAENWQEAEKECARRKLGEMVIGVLQGVGKFHPSDFK